VHRRAAQDLTTYAARADLPRDERVVLHRLQEAQPALAIECVALDPLGKVRNDCLATAHIDAQQAPVTLANDDRCRARRIDAHERSLVDAAELRHEPGGVFASQRDGEQAA
jgi:hypothetical protein